MRGWWLGSTVLALAACSDAAPYCAQRLEGSFSMNARGEALVDHPLVVVASGLEELALEAELACDPVDEISLTLSFTDPPAGAWLPPSRAEVLVTVTQDPEGWGGSHAVLRSAAGVLLWEGGSATTDPAATPRFRAVDVPDAEACSDRPDPCVLQAPIRAAVRTDDGEVVLASGEHRVVTVDAEPYLAVVRATRTEHVDGCNVTDGVQGPSAAGYLVRTTATDLSLVEPAPPAADECPALAPADGDPCTTRADLECAFEPEPGCTETLACAGCFWRLRGAAGTCLDPADCMENGEDGSCGEEAVCTDCTCPDPIGVRYRCVQPGADCPACE